uniref:Uncharacterized protein n=1 Tax=viral metagenome TaxID=1070528 RepID=A0A6H1Z6X7_9ZZZZ
MKVVYDLIAGGSPPPIDLMYNGDLAVDSVTKRYKGSLAKMMDVDDVDHGKFHTFAGVATALENISGILEEEQGITGNYLPDDATYSVAYRKITPLFPSSVIEAEYVRKDAAGTASTDTGATGTAGSANLTITVTDDEPIGGWVYFLTGSNAGYLHFITDSTSTTSATLTPVLNYAVASADTFLHIAPACTNALLIDATYTGLKSEIALAARTCFVNGLSSWIEASEIGKTKLDRAKHAGLKISGAKFYHHFTLTGAYSATPNYWIVGQKPS